MVLKDEDNPFYLHQVKKRHAKVTKSYEASMP